MSVGLCNSDDPTVMREQESMRFPGTNRNAHAVAILEAVGPRLSALDRCTDARSRAPSLRPIPDGRRVNAIRNEVKEPEELECGVRIAY